MDELLTLKEIAKRLDVPESNLRYYRNRIGDFLPSAGKGRRRRYFPEAEDILRKTIEYISEGVTLDRVYTIFAENKPLVLSDNIAKPAQEEVASLIVEKIRQYNVFSQSDPLAENGVAQLSQKVDLILSEINGMKTTLSEGHAALGDTREVQQEVASLNDRLSGLQEENRQLKEILSEKEQIIDGQKKALVQAREKREMLANELEQLRSATPESATMFDRVNEG
jgi:DNA-binding transcriptional MerR regulator